MKLIVNNLVKNYEKKEVLKNINYEFEEGKIYGLLGRNGAGKTTLFNCINSDIEYQGNITLDNKEITSDEISYCIAEPLVPEFLTGKEFLKFFIDINKDKIKDLKTPEEYFDKIHLEKDALDKLLKEYSTGMKNKIQMLVNMILDTKILLLDEPLTSLDVIAQEEMKTLLKELKKDHILIVSTHIMELAIDLCDEIVILDNGTLFQVTKQNMNKEYIINHFKGDTND